MAKNILLFEEDILNEMMIKIRSIADGSISYKCLRNVEFFVRRSNIKSALLILGKFKVFKLPRSSEIIRRKIIALGTLKFHKRYEI
jgi:hypothetical protein